MSEADRVVAIVDDDAAVRRALARLLRSLAYRTAMYASGEDFLASLAAERPCCVVLDQHMPGLDGLSVVARMREQGFDVPVIVITGFEQRGMSERCRRVGVAACLTKPIEREAMSSAIRSATEQ